ncbi:MAG TPA: hypothetical protein VIY73_25320, partial [Polyangiaceae bacterium]
RAAADLARTRQRDPLAAQRHLAAALRLRPHDADLLRAYRDVGTAIAKGASEMPDEPPTSAGPASFPVVEDASATHRTVSDLAPAPHLAAPGPRSPAQAPRLPFDVTLAVDADEGDAGDEARIEELTRKLHANAADDAVADELAALLEKAGRGHELLALLSGRLEDATPERRAVLAPKARRALEALADQAARAGRNEEAALFRDAIDTLLR